VGNEIYKNRNCFITGATGGIGRHLAMKMAENNCNLFLTSTDAAKLKELKEDLVASYGGNIDIFYEPGDLNKISEIEKLINAVKERMKGIDILVNCVGVFITKSLMDSTLEEFDTCFNLNIRASFLFSREFSKGMVNNGWGRIINIGSSSAYSGYRDTSIYCASKHAILGFSRALHDELKSHNVRVFCISPAAVKTEMGKTIKNQNFNTFIDPEEMSQYISFICSFDKGMISEEIRLNRMVIE